jgi:hypothetical protein
MYTDVVLLVVLIALIYYTPPVLASLSTTLLGKLLLTWCTLSFAVYRGRNAGVLSAFITVLLLYRGTREETREGATGGKDAGTETVADLECEGDDCPEEIIKEAAEGDESGAEAVSAKPAKSKVVESFLGSSGNVCGILASSRLSLGEALRSIGSNKLPVSSTRGNGSKECPQGTICPQSAESVKSGFFS